MMKIKTKLGFRLRRLVEHTQSAKPEMKNLLREWLLKQQYLLQRTQLERELFQSCMLLKNLSIVHRELPMSTDFLLEQLMESGRLLHPVYADMLTIYRNGNPDGAFGCLYQKVPIPAAEKFARILRRLDYLHPEELIAQMNAFQETFTAEQKTKAMARAERKSLITTLASTATIFVVLLNFVVVVVFLDTLEILSHLF